MRNILYGIVFFALLFFILPQLSYAHFYAIDKKITVILHVDPNDSPIPGENATLYFDIGDATHRFDLEKCDCILSITEQGKSIYHNALVERKDKNFNIWGSSVPFIFPQRDVYHITLNGKPKSTNAFQTFTISWYFRVDEYPQVSPVALQIAQPLHRQSDPTFIYFVAGFLGIIVCTGIAVFLVKR
jgi:hypothetical protein